MLSSIECRVKSKSLECFSCIYVIKAEYKLPSTRSVICLPGMLGSYMGKKWQTRYLTGKKWTKTTLKPERITTDLMAEVLSIFFCPSREVPVGQGHQANIWFQKSQNRYKLISTLGVL